MVSLRHLRHELHTGDNPGCAKSQYPTEIPAMFCFVTELHVVRRTGCLHRAMCFDSVIHSQAKYNRLWQE